MFSQDTLVQLISTYGLLILFVLAIFEGPIVAAIAGYFVKLGTFEWLPVLAVLVLADMVGDTMFYWIGSHGRNKSLTKYRHKAGLTDERLADLQAQFERRGPLILIFGKVTHVPGMAILLAAGMSHMNYFKFMFYNFLGSVPKSALFLGIGYLLGAAFGNLDKYILEYSVAIVVLLVVAALIYWFRYRHKSKDKN